LYIVKNKKENERIPLVDKIINYYIINKKDGYENKIIYDMIQDKFDIPNNRRKSMIRNPISLLNTGRWKNFVKPI